MPTASRDIPNLIEIVKMPTEVENFGSGWHADMSYRDEPPLGAVLHGLEVPPVGGDTMFANMYRAYETLSDGMKQIVETLVGLHDSHEPADYSQYYKGMSLTDKDGAVRQVSRHPLVKTHPVTGRKSLFISPDYCMELEGMTARREPHDPGLSGRACDAARTLLSLSLADQLHRHMGQSLHHAQCAQ